MDLVGDLNRCPALGIERLDTKVVQDKKLLPFYFCNFFDIGSIRLGHFEFGEQLGRTGIEYLVTEHTGLIAYAEAM